MTLMKNKCLIAHVIFAWLLVVPSVLAGVSITKCKMTDKNNGGEVTSGYAHAELSVQFVGEANCNCENKDLTYTWDFNDGTSDTGATVNHKYDGLNAAGTRYPSLVVTCTCGSSNSASGLTVYAINGIKITQIGDIDVTQTGNENKGRLCFDSERRVQARALPEGVAGSNKIDYRILIGSGYARLIDSASGTMTLPSSSPNQWPTSNDSWGVNTLYATINRNLSSIISGVPNDLGELNLTGKTGEFQASKTVKVFYDQTGAQNPHNPGWLGTKQPNWFYYYKDNAGGGDYGYHNASYSTGTNGSKNDATIRLGNEIAAGSPYLEFDYSNPGGRLKAIRLSSQNENEWCKYYRYFLSVLAHERHHVHYELSSSGGSSDPDKDRLTTTFEVGTSKTHPHRRTSAVNNVFTEGLTDDSEVYAYGPVMRAARESANTDNDWAKPGTNWPE